MIGQFLALVGPTSGARGIGIRTHLPRTDCYGESTQAGDDGSDDRVEECCNSDHYGYRWVTKRELSIICL